MDFGVGARPAPDWCKPGSGLHGSTLSRAPSRLFAMDPRRASNLPEWGHNSGKGVQRVDFGILGSWCKPIAVPCKQSSHKHSPTPRIEQRTRVALAGSMGRSRTVPRTLAGTVRHKTRRATSTRNPCAAARLVLPMLTSRTCSSYATHVRSPSWFCPLCLAQWRAPCGTKLERQPQRAIRVRRLDSCCQCRPVTHASRSQHVRCFP